MQRNILIIFILILYSSYTLALDINTVSKFWNVYDESSYSKGLSIQTINGHDFEGILWETDTGPMVTGSFSFKGKTNYITFKFQGYVTIDNEYQQSDIIYYGWIGENGNYISGYYDDAEGRKPWYARKSEANIIGTMSKNLDIHIPSISYTPPLKEGDIFSFPVNYWGNLQFSHEENGALYWKLKDFGINTTGFYK